ncbi:putative serine/threonine protein kinase [Gordonia rhizosphera NBRC 16068]|uniref:non-specific serine/threonine protein kinase n=1 Tax=Gordonia rhizosphera NBRC 16068 TaxID=1108045 RepID=K6VMF8_9ACTN|nr:putative serine/threonine protein kinase [Gordonia rhizosphera NBRC 16068]
MAGRYRLRSRIGGGGMGTVWLAHDQLLARDVAVKQVVSTEGLSEESADNLRQRAMREGRIAAKLAHRNAIAVHDVALDRGEPWLVMEYLPSRSVAQILHTARTLDVDQAAQIGAQVADAMATAHTAGIIHRDIKPGNILVTTTGRDAGLVKITDFGISRAKDDTAANQSGVITGTPAYFAPEVARGADPGEASDVYSLGATVYTLVEGRPPFGVDDDSLALLHKVARARINPMTRADALEPVLLAMLEPHPDKRPTMAQARDRLARVAAGSRGSIQQVLTSPLRRPDGGTPVWAQRSPRPSRSHPTGTHRPVVTPTADDAPAATSTSDPATPRSSASPAPSATPRADVMSGPRPRPTPRPTWSGPSTSTTTVVLGLFALVALIAILVGLAVALL